MPVAICLSVIVAAMPKNALVSPHASVTPAHASVTSANDDAPRDNVMTARTAGSSPATTVSAMARLLDIMQHVALTLEQAINTRRWSWHKLVFLNERRAAALNCVKMLHGYHKAGEAAIQYLDEDLRNLLAVPDFAEQMLTSLQGEAKLNAALHFLRGLEADLQTD
jgi:hypothetical protein